MKVLILCYDFPPLISIGGQRPYSWYKYLPNAEVTVITRHWSRNILQTEDYVKATSTEVLVEENEQGNKVIRVPFVPNFRDRLLIRFGYSRLTTFRKMLTLFYSFSEHLFFVFDSKAAIYFEAQKQMARQKPDVILATGEPFILFKYAHLLAAEHRVKWVADYRDGWTTNQAKQKWSVWQRLTFGFFRWREKKYLSNASLVTTAAPAYAEVLQTIHPEKKIQVVYNGFDEDAFSSTASYLPETDKFIITYAGTIYPHQNLEMFLQGVKDFLFNPHRQPVPVEIRFYGFQSQPEAVQRIKNFDEKLQPHLVFLPKIPYSELAQQLQQSHLLLLLSKKGADWLNAKVFDYLAAKRKILLVENDQGVLEQIITQARGGYCAGSAGDVTRYLERETANFTSGKSFVSAVNEEYKKYSRKNQAEIMAAYLNQLL